MRYSGGFLVASFVVLGLASSSLGQPGVQWSPDFEGAKVHARQGGRLVMAYFSAPWCPACIEMERSVFSQPGIASSVHAAFIPVKINHDQTPELVRHYGVRSLPAILVLSPDGAPLDRIEGRVTPQQLGERLNRVVAQNLRPATLPTSPQQAIAHQPPGSRPYPGPHVAGPHVAGPPLAGLASRPPTAGPPASRPPAAGPPAAGPPAVGPPLAGPPPVVQSPPTPPAPASATPPLHATAPVTPGPRYAAEVARTPAVQQNPPLAIEGYCVVSLCDDLLAGQRRWILG
ncbi:MAG: thioredoxin family protein, partial [Patescibacteria group bacterium]|nr:thioredoxin family protein [Patescibacteria group bacterium]